MLLRGYQPASRCTGAPQEGSKALMSWFLGAYRGYGGTNLGIYNCRDVRGGATTSLHGEGRAADLGINPHGAAWAWNVANALRLNSQELGVQCLIYGRKIWSGSYPDAGWRDYTGQADHFDHIHTELTWDSARTLAVPRISQVLSAVQLPAPPKPAATAPSGRLLGRGLDNDEAEVRRLQTKLNKDFPLYSKLRVDGDFGAATEKVVREFQRRQRLTVDGKVGPATRRALGL